MNTNSRLFWIDNLRAIACIGIVFLHVSGPSLLVYNESNFWSWILLLSIHSLTRISVPLFLMITGVLLFNTENNSYKSYFIRIKRIVIPLFLWSIVYIIIYLILKMEFSNEFSFKEALNIVNNSFLYGAAYHFWYMYMLICFYLILPIVNIFLLKPQALIVFIVLWLLLLSSTYTKNNGLLDKILFLVGHLGYLYLGFYLNIIYLNRWFYKVFALLLLISGFLLTAYPVYHSIGSKMGIDTASFYRLKINIVMMAIGIFVWARELNFKIWMLKLISINSLGIYFVHLIFIMLVNKLGIDRINSSIFLLLCLKSILVLMFSYLFVSFLNRVSLLNRVINY